LGPLRPQAQIAEPSGDQEESDKTALLGVAPSRCHGAPQQAEPEDKADGEQYLPEAVDLTSIPVLPGGRGHATGNEAVDVLRFPEVIARRCMKCIGDAWVAASYFEIVIGIPTFSILPMVVWNKMLRIRKVVRSHTVSFTE
jgi:hypothetical protein